ncbi:hypothetical protein ACRALDRAFT_1070240 [Sodiomyces alcalophilus JCM 7366]|uniref:uncharacterized protein n=1 Tax=Sodiomyces alcalophilus JCM 7366 TaxID=591952 RepID=UPI0039B3D27A
MHLPLSDDSAPTMPGRQSEKGLRRRRDRQWLRMLMASDSRPLDDRERLKRKLIFYFPEMATKTVGSFFDRPQFDPGDRPIDYWNKLTLTAQWILVKTTSEGTGTGVAIAWVEQLALPREDLYQFFKTYLRYLQAFLKDTTSSHEKHADEALRLFTTLDDITELYRAPLPTDLVTDEDINRAVWYLQKINNHVHIDSVREWVGPQGDFIYLPFEEQIWAFFGMRLDWEAALTGEIDVHPDLFLGGGPLAPTPIEDGFDYDDETDDEETFAREEEPSTGRESSQLLHRIQEAGTRIKTNDIRPVKYIDPRLLYKEPVDEFGHRLAFKPEGQAASRGAFKDREKRRSEAARNFLSYLHQETQSGPSISRTPFQKGHKDTGARGVSEESGDSDESEGSPKNLYRERQEKLFGGDLSSLCEDEDDDDYTPPNKRRSGQRTRGTGQTPGSHRGGARRGRYRRSDVQTESGSRGRGRGRGRPRGSRNKVAAGSTGSRATSTQPGHFPSGTPLSGHQRPEGQRAEGDQAESQKRHGEQMDCDLKAEKPTE